VTFAPRVSIEDGLLVVILVEGPGVERVDFDAVLDQTDFGDLVGLEILDVRTQLGGAAVPSSPLEGTPRWSHDTEIDAFYIRLGVSDDRASIHKSVVGVAEIDQANRLASLQVRVSPPERGRQAVHEEPVWRERSNFIIAATLPDQSEIATEQLWARQLGNNRFEICCIPFFVYDIALGDLVETTDEHLVTRVVSPSGRYVFRVWFGASFHPRDEIADALQALGSLVEWSSRNLLAVDAIDEGHAQRVADFLAEKEHAEQLVYETGRSQL
jgi:hypothetical protein